MNFVGSGLGSLVTSIYNTQSILFPALQQVTQHVLHKLLTVQLQATTVKPPNKGHIGTRFLSF